MMAWLGLTAFHSGGCQPAAETSPADPVSLALIAERTAATPGDTLELGLRFEIEPGWHLYWEGRNDSGAPISVEPKLPEGYVVGALQWPGPERHISPGGILDHVYQGEVMLILPVVIPATAPPGTQSALSFAVEWVVCRESCQLGFAELALSMPIVSPAQDPPPSQAERIFAATRHRLPRPWPEGKKAVTLNWQDTILVIESRDAAALAFFPDLQCSPLMNPLVDCESAAGRLVMRFRADADRPEPVASGVLEVRLATQDAAEYFEINLPCPRTGVES